MLVPVLRSIGSGVVLAQPRGNDFADACAQAQGKYEVDTYEANGSVTTTTVELEGKAMRERGGLCIFEQELRRVFCR